MDDATARPGLRFALDVPAYGVDEFANGETLTHPITRVGDLPGVIGHPYT
ncbi:hypothetical protein AB0H51_24000 [Streptomyces griseoluteus]